MRPQLNNNLLFSPVIVTLGLITISTAFSAGPRISLPSNSGISSGLCNNSRRSGAKNPQYIKDASSITCALIWIELNKIEPKTYLCNARMKPCPKYPQYSKDSSNVTLVLTCKELNKMEPYTRYGYNSSSATSDR